MSESFETELVRKAALGDQESFAKLVRTYSNVVYGVAYSAVRDFHLAQDIAQESLVKAWFKLEQLKDHGKFGAWLIQLTRNSCHDYYRKNKLQERPLSEAEKVADDVPLEEQIDRRSNAREVWRAFDALDEKYRTPILMHFIGGFKAKEISGLLGIPLRTAETRLRRAKEQVRKELIDVVERNARDIQLGEAFVRKVKARIKNALQVRLVADLGAARAFYRDVLGFTVDDWNHAERDGVGFLLQQAARPEDVRPNARPAGEGYPNDWQGPASSWDTYAYSDFDGVQSLYEEFAANGADIVYAPQVEQLGSGQWKEFAVRDLDGYVLVFGGGD